MKKLTDYMAEELSAAFEKAGYDSSYGKVGVSNRLDLCEYQCNGAMAGAKAYKKAPFMIADDVVGNLADSKVFSMKEMVKPGFINLKVSEEFLADYLKEMEKDEKLGADTAKEPKTIVIDYGGPNVAKPLHVGHLRSAIIGESIKRIGRFVGHKVIGDVHLGDWGLQMGLIITELKHRQPELVYFDDSYTGEYPAEAPFTISELEEIYPCASGKSKEDEAYRQEALEATHLLQQGKPGYMALWNHIMSVSVTDLKRNYANLNVSFDLWKKESDAQPYIPDMVEMMKEKGFAYEDQGALVVDVKEETDTKEIPPCMLLKSDGASLGSPCPASCRPPQSGGEAATFGYSRKGLPSHLNCEPHPAEPADPSAKSPFGRAAAPLIGPASPSPDQFPAASPSQSPLSRYRPDVPLPKEQNIPLSRIERP